MASVQYGAPAERIKIVKDGITIDLGRKTLQFIEAPWLHWPETMFTYLKEDKILFPCDFLGQHTAFGFWDGDVEELIPFAKRYFGEIMMPFRSMGKKAIEKIKGLEIEIIAPSHGSFKLLFHFEICFLSPRGVTHSSLDSFVTSVP